MISVPKHPSPRCAPLLSQARMPERLLGRHRATSEDELLGAGGSLRRAGLFGVWLPETVSAPRLSDALRSGHWTVWDGGRGGQPQSWPGLPAQKPSYSRGGGWAGGQHSGFQPGMWWHLRMKAQSTPKLMVKMIQPLTGELPGLALHRWASLPPSPQQPAPAVLARVQPPRSLLPCCDGLGSQPPPLALPAALFPLAWVDQD